MAEERLMSTLTSQAMALDQTTQVTVGAEVPETHTATPMQYLHPEVTETTHLEAHTETSMALLRKEIRTASGTRTADMTGRDGRAAGAPNTTTTAGRGCRIARKTFTHGRIVGRTLTGLDLNCSERCGE